ncbi:MAG: NUDIX domain-containing protein [Lapillicoccus sp.]
MSDTALWVVGVDDRGVERVRQRLAHGDDPVHLLAREGYATEGPSSIVGEVNPHTVSVVYSVRPDAGASAGPAGPAVEVTRDPGMELAHGEEPVALQRVAVYAVVRSSRGVLFAQNSALTNAAGRWGLAGGGLDRGELPEEALHREVWEETGQRVDVTGVAAVTTRHWVGRAPSGRLEDFHAVRLVYRATCADPTDPVVHDVDGTTAAAAWFRPDEIDRLPLAVGTRDVLVHLSRDGGG